MQGAVLDPDFQRQIKEEVFRLHSNLMDIPEPVAEEEYEIEVAMNTDDMEPDEWAEQGILAEGPEEQGELSLANGSGALCLPCTPSFGAVGNGTVYAQIATFLTCFVSLFLTEAGEAAAGEAAPAEAAPATGDSHAGATMDPEMALRHEAWRSLEASLQGLPIKHRPHATECNIDPPPHPASASQPGPSHGQQPSLSPAPPYSQPASGSKGRGSGGGRTRASFRARGGSRHWEPTGQERWRRRPGRGVQFEEDSEETEVVIPSQDSVGASVETPVPPSDRQLRQRAEPQNLCETDTEQTDASDDEPDWAYLYGTGKE